MEPQVDQLIERSLEIGAPKGMYCIVEVESIDGQTLTIGGQRFTSSILVERLQLGDTVYPYLATCGRELEELTDTESDAICTWWAGAVQRLALIQAVDAVKTEVQKEAGPSKRLSSINPGSGDARIFPIEQQKPLFHLLEDTFQSIGVELTESCMMRPTKSLSGIFFFSNEPYCNCHTCPREDCPERLVEFEG